MCNFISRVALVAIFPLFLAACLPGESESRKTLQRTQDASLNVQADKIAAGMVTAAIRIATSAEADSVDTPDLKVDTCGSDKVIAFIPSSASFVRDGELSSGLAKNMRHFLEKQVGVDHVVNTDALPGDCSVDVTLVATNSPLLVLDLDTANLIPPPENDSDIIGVSMMPCTGGRPGVITHKTKSDGSVVVEDNCGTAPPTSLPDITLSGGEIPDWQSRLAGMTNAMTNITCIASASGCTPVDIDAGQEIECDDQAERTDYLVNPRFDNTARAFLPSNNTFDCGHGWDGEVISRIKSKRCRVKRNGVMEEIANKVFDVAYVGAQCKKNNVLLHDSCPASYNPEGKIVSRKNIVMTRPFALSPSPVVGKPGINKSVLSYRTSGGATNIDSEMQALINRSQEGNLYVQRATSGSLTLLGQARLHHTSQNLGASDPDYPASYDNSFVFDNRFAQEVANEEIGTFATTTCYGAAQTCQTGVMPEILAVVVDRSYSMTAPTAHPITPHQTSCRATMANLFTEGGRNNACIAARQWQLAVAPFDHKRQELLSLYTSTRSTDPVSTISGPLFDQLMTHIDAIDMFTGNNMRAQMTQMMWAMKDERFLPRMKYGLMVGQDCYPKDVRDNTYGICAPVYATTEELTLADFNSMPLKTCQSSCPGSCITDAAGRDEHTHAPVTHSVNRIELVNSFIQTNLIPNIPYGIKFNYSEFIEKGKIDDVSEATVGKRPVIADIGDDVDNADPNRVRFDIDMSFWVRQLSKQMNEKFIARDPLLGGDTPLYQAVDKSIDQMRHAVLGQVGHPKYSKDSPAVLAILSDGNDNYTSYKSSYFGRNFCEREIEPEKFQCVKKVACGWADVFKLCRERIDVDLNSVRHDYGMETVATRKAWCDSRGYDHDVEKVNKPGGKMVHYDSLVGVMGRNFPNTKVYYLDIDSTPKSKIAKDCTGMDRTWYGDGPDAKRVLYTFHYDEHAGKDIYKAFNQMLGGDYVPPEIGRRICEEKFGVGVNVDTMTIPANRPGKPLNVNTTLLNSCEGYLWLNVGAPDHGAPQNIRDPLVSSDLDNLYGEGSDSGSSSTPGVGDTCINGRDRDTMQSCGPDDGLIGP